MSDVFLETINDLSLWSKSANSGWCWIECRDAWYPSYRWYSQMWTSNCQNDPSHKCCIERTESVAVSDLCSPTANQVYLVLWRSGHFRVPRADQLNVFVYLVWLDLMLNDAVYVFTTRKNLTKASLNLVVHLLTFLGTVYKIRQRAGLLLLAGPRLLRGNLCILISCVVRTLKTRYALLCSCFFFS